MGTGEECDGNAIDGPVSCAVSPDHTESIYALETESCGLGGDEGIKKRKWDMVLGEGTNKTMWLWRRYVE